MAVSNELLSIEVTGTERVLDRLEGKYLLPRMRSVYEEQLRETIDLLHEKVIANLSGKILRPRTDQLRSSIRKATETAGGEFVGWVYVEPETPKAWALEYGGKGAYIIPLGKAGVLANIDEDFFSKRAVMHPPAKEYRYLRDALDEIRATISPDLRAYMEEAVFGTAR